MADVPLFRGRSHTVLVIEDDSANRRLLTSSLTQGSRSLGLVAAFDAKIHDGPYRDALPLDIARDEIRRGAGRQFDPELSAAFLDILEATPGRPT